jgi:hypothetical protein
LLISTGQTLITRELYFFSLGNIATMSGITDGIDEGWVTRKVSKCFNKENNIANQQQEVLMTTS